LHDASNNAACSVGYVEESELEIVLIDRDIGILQTENVQEEELIVFEGLYDRAEPCDEYTLPVHGAAKLCGIF
jgi:hypothetical protein